MTKIRCGDSIGLDLDQVVLWERFTSKEEKKVLLLVFTGVTHSCCEIPEDSVGSQAFSYLHKLLLDRFAIDLASEKNLPCENDDSSVEDKPLELPF
jgi:hypothetical protein